jgi:type VI secretion system protein ImpM
MAAPFWRFAALLPYCRDKGLAGVMIPSIDKVGRHYPLSVIAVLDSPKAAIAAALRSQHWFCHIERVALSALLGHLSFAEFDAKLASTMSPGGSGLLSPDALRCGVGALDPTRLSPAAISRSAPSRPAAFSLWWTRTPGRGRQAFLMFPGLPGSDDFLRLVTPASDLPAAA